MNVLFIGDIVGRPGRNAIKKILPDLKKDLKLDLVVANGENLASGNSMTYDTYKEMVDAGIDYFTSGNHIWKRKEFIKYLDEKDIKVLRPANYPKSVAGKGYAKIKIGSNDVLLINLLGRTFISDTINNPFFEVEEILKINTEKIILVDFHAEATSEANAMGYFLNGRVSAVVGTHTHVPTADARILPNNTAYITDIGMTGVLNSAIGIEAKPVIKYFLTGIPWKSEPATGTVQFNAVLIKIDPKNGQSTHIELIQKIVE